MPAITARKRMDTVRLYIHGYTYQEIVDKTGISKGSVVSILTDLKNGNFPLLENIYEEIDALRDLSVELRRRDMSLSQAIVGIAAFQGIESLGIQPSEVKNVVEQVRRLTPDGVETREFLMAVSVVTELEQRTGMDPKELEERVVKLENRFHTLEKSWKELEPMSKEVIALTEQHDSLITQIATLESKAKGQKESLDAEIGERTERVQELRGQVADTGQLVGQLGKRVLDQEDSLQQISCRSNQASNDLKRILSLGLSETDLPELAMRLAAVAYHHKIEPTRYRAWLFTCLDQAGSLLGLDTLIKARRDELTKEERTLAAARKSQVTTAAELKALKKQLAEDRASQKTRRKVWDQEIDALCRSSDQRLATQQVQLQKAARALGTLEGNIDSFDWVRPLVNLIQGIDSVTAKEVRTAATFLCLSLIRYLELHVGDHDKPGRIGYLLEQLLEVLEGWEV